MGKVKGMWSSFQAWNTKEHPIIMYIGGLALIFLVAFSLLMVSKANTLSVITKNIDTWFGNFNALSFIGIVFISVIMFSCWRAVVAETLRQDDRKIRVFFIALIEVVAIATFINPFLLYIENSKIANIGSAVTFITTLLIAPIAFVLWTYRNEDKQADIENARNTIKQKERADTANLHQLNFHKIEEWATTGSDKSETLQVAAIHQLAPYFLGKHGEEFIRPAWEIYRALLASWVPSQKEKDFDKLIDRDFMRKTRPSYISAIEDVLRENFDYLMEFSQRDKLSSPLKGTDFKYFDFKGVDDRELNMENAKLPDVNLSHAFLLNANFRGAGLIHANLKYATLYKANFDGASLAMANLDSTDMRAASFRNTTFLGRYDNGKPTKIKLVGVDLREAVFDNVDLEGAQFHQANLQSTTFIKATLYNVNFSTAKFDNTIFEKCKYDKNTLFPHGFDPKGIEGLTLISEEEKRECAEHEAKKA